MILPGLIAAAVLTAVLVIAIVLHERALKQPRGTKPRVIKLELAGTGRASFDLLDEIGSAGRQATRTAIGIDRWIIVGYSPGLAVWSLLSIWIVDETSTGTIRTIGIVIAITMAIAALLAGLLDVRENRKLLELLDTWPDTPVPPGTDARDAAPIKQLNRRDAIEAFDAPSAAARAAAVPKFALIGAIALWGLVIACITVTHYAA